MAHDSAPASVKIAPPPEELERPALVENNRSLGWISDTVAGVIVGKGYGLRSVGICGHACPRFNLA